VGAATKQTPNTDAATARELESCRQILKQEAFQIMGLYNATKFLANKQVRSALERKLEDVFAFQQVRFEGIGKDTIDSSIDFASPYLRPFFVKAINNIHDVDDVERLACWMKNRQCFTPISY
jgi:hypothetical protein